MDWKANNDPYLLPDSNRLHLIHVADGDGDVRLAWPEQNGWCTVDREVIKHSDVTHYCVVEKPF